MNKKTKILIIASAIILMGLGIVSCYTYKQFQLGEITNFEQCQAAGYPIQESYPARCVLPNGKSFTQEIDNGVACTADAKLCPDGSYVGRTAPDCEFAACPAEE